MRCSVPALVGGVGLDQERGGGGGHLTVAAIRAAKELGGGAAWPAGAVEVGALAAGGGPCTGSTAAVGEGRGCTAGCLAGRLLSCGGFGMAGWSQAGSQSSRSRGGGGGVAGAAWRARVWAVMTRSDPAQLAGHALGNWLCVDRSLLGAPHPRQSRCLTHPGRYCPEGRWTAPWRRLQLPGPPG